VVVDIINERVAALDDRLADVASAEWAAGAAAAAGGVEP
jgi:hypothetical protein